MNTSLSLVNIIVINLLLSTILSSQSVFDIYEKKIISKNGITKKTHWVYGKHASSGYKSLEITFNKAGDKLEEVTYRSTGKIALKRNYKYDARGNVIEYQSYDGTRDKITYKKFVKYDNYGNKVIEAGFDGVDRFDNKYSYDSRERITEIKYFISDKLTERRVVTYAGQKQEYTIYNAAGSVTGKYIKVTDAKKNVTQEITYSSGGNETKKTIFSYDVSGNKTSESKYYSGKLTETTTYIFKDRRLEKQYIQKPGEPKYLDHEYEYDVSGKLLSEKWIDTRSGKYSTKSYKYDSKGNATEINSYYAAYNFNEDIKITYSY